MELLLIFKNDHPGRFLHLMLNIVSADYSISLHISQYAWNDIVVEFATDSLHVHLLEWFEILEHDLKSSALFKAVSVDSHSWPISLGETSLYEF